MTPLIDVTFLLLTYFMLASHYASAERPDMKIPQPDDSQAVDKRPEEKIIVNMLYAGDNHDPELMFGPDPVRSLQSLADRLNAAGRFNPSCEVILRADRRLPYGHVRRVMETVAAAKLSHLQVVAEFGQK